MIDFRYHLVSIVAVFLALAVGIVLGSTELRGAALSALDRTSSSLSAKLNAADAANNALQQQASGDRAFAQAAEPRLLAHLLDGKRAVIVTAPGAPAGVINGISTALRDAGVGVTGQVALSTKFADTSGSNLGLLNQLTGRVAPAGTSLVNGSPQQQAAQVLASAILSPAGQSGSGQPGSGRTASGQAASTGGQAAHTILSSYSAGGFLAVSGDPSSGATLAVIVAPASPPAGGNDSPGQAVVSLAQELGPASQAAVVAGSSSSSGQGSAIAAVRSSSAASNVSTVDDADSVTGQIVAAQALAQQVNGHKPGSYGTQADASAVGPSPAPMPGPTGSSRATARKATAKGNKS